MRKLHFSIPALFALLVILAGNFHLKAQSNPTPFGANPFSPVSRRQISLDAEKGLTKRIPVAGQASVARVIVKLRAPMAKMVESSLPLDDMLISAGTATNPQVATFINQYSARSLVPLYPSIVREKLQRNMTALQLASEVRRRFASRANRLNATFQPPDLSRTYVLDLAGTGESVRPVMNLLRADPNVEYAEPDNVITIDSTPNDPYLSSSGTWGQTYGDLWGIRATNAPLAWDTTLGSGIVVAVVDTGIDYNHPDISANVWTNPGEIAGNGMDDDQNGYIDDTMGWNFVANDNNPLDDHGHGTHVSGTIAAVGNNGIGVIGVAWQAKIIPLKAIDSSGTGYDSALADAIVYAADNGADIISNSWGGYGSSQTISDAVSYAYNQGAVVVAAAGNSAIDASSFYPANLPDVITVSATNPDGSFASFSNFGTKIDVAAPGVDILSLRAAGTSMGTPVGDGYTRASGTSMATPHVSGASALILAQHPDYSNEQVRQALRSSATDLGAAGYDLSFGYGGLNASAAMGIVNPLEVKIQSIQYGSSPTSPITITGIARGTGFASYTLEYGAGTLPTSWTLFQTSSSPATGVLGQFDPSEVPNGSYTIRLTAYNTSGGAFSDRTQVSVSTLFITIPVPPNYPTSSTSFKPGKVIPIVGTAAGAGFQNFQVRWAAGLNATSGWQTTGIALTNGGLAPIVNSQLATWDTATITQAGYYTIQVSMAASLPVSPVTTTVYLQPDLLSVNWPVWLDQAPNTNAGLLPALNRDSSFRLMLTGLYSRTLSGVFTPGALWTLGLDGSSQKTLLPDFGGYQQPTAADLDNAPGDEVITAYSTQLRVFNQDLSSYWFAPTTSVGFYHHPFMVEDLDGDSQLETIAVGNDDTNQVAYVYAWRPTGQLVNSNFPIQIADMNPLNGWINHLRVLVGDFDGDGKKEIVVQEGLSSTTYTLRLFAANGTPLSWNVPVLTGFPGAMIAADLDHNGTMETILLSYSGTQATLHVFQPDGSERAGWPLQLPNPVEWSQAYLAVGDLDRNGQEEIVLSHQTEIYVFKANGTSYSAAWPLNTGTVDSYAVAIGDVDGDGYAEIVTVRNDVVANTYYDQKLLAIRRDGTTAKTWQLTGMNGCDLYTNVLPVIGDFNRDGVTDIAVSYDVSAPNIPLPAVVTILSTGAAYHSSAMDWPMIWRDARGTAVLRRSLDSTTSIVSSANPSIYGQTASFTVSVAPVTPGGPTLSGNANILEGTNPVGSCSLTSGSCTVSTSDLAVGTHSLSTKYAGDANFSPSAVVLSQVVNAAVPSLTLSASSFTFGNQAVGTTSTALTEMLGNTGTASLTVSTVAMGGTNASDFAKSADTCAGAVLAPNGTCVVSVTFTPAGNGARSGSLALIDNASGSPQTVSLSGIGTEPVVSLSPAQTFSAQLVGSTSSSQTVTLTNTGNSSLTFSAIGVSSPFAIATSGTTCSTANSVAATHTCTVAVTFTPTAAGAAPGSISFRDNAPNSPQVLALSGTGQDFTFAPPPGSSTSATVTHGQEAHYTLGVGGQGGMSGTVAFTCVGAPSEATCTVSPNPLTVGNSAANVAVTVTTTAASIGGPNSQPLSPPPPRSSPGLRELWMLAFALIALAWLIGHRYLPRANSRRATIAVLASGGLLALALAGCGGGGGGGPVGPPANTGTPTGTYTLTITGSAGSGSSTLSHSTTLSLTVN